jgi:predicted MFS family arabinose efflux permease
MGYNEGIPRRTVRTILSRDFIFAFLAFFAFLAASRALLPTMPVYLEALGTGKKEIGVLVGILGAASLVSRLIAGVAILRYSEKRVMIVGALLSALSYLSYVVVRPFWPFFAMRFLEGVAFACVDTAVLAFVVNIVPEARRGQAIGYVLLAPPLAMAISASSGVLIMNGYGPVVLFSSCTALSLCSFFSAFMLKKRGRTRIDEVRHEGGVLPFNVGIVVPAVVTFLINFAIGGLFAFTPLYAVTCGIDNPGPFFSAIAVMLILGRTVGGRVLSACDKERIIPAAILVLIASLVVLLLSRTLPGFVLSGALWGFGAAFVNPASMAYALEYAGSSGGTSVGTYQALGDMGTALGPATMGVVVSLAGYRTMFFCLAMLCLLNMGYFWFFVTKRGRMVERRW